VDHLLRTDILVFRPFEELGLGAEGHGELAVVGLLDRAGYLEE
jgi:hypothetical protein